MGKYFGTDGFRGEANVNLTADHAFKIGRFLGWYYGEMQKAKCKMQSDTSSTTCAVPLLLKEKASGGARIVIGKDTRRSSYMFEYALAAGITASGGNAYLLHVTTTPSVAYITRNDDFDCGVMISASHNPFYDNGIKLLNSNGEKMEQEVLDLIEAYLDGEEIAATRTVEDACPYESVPFATGAEIGRTVDYVFGRNRYIGYLISLGMYSFKGLRIGLDCANGAAWNIAKSVFEAMGAKVCVIGDEPDGTNITAGCGSTHMEALQKLVVEEQLDLGFAYDGDADRCLAVDENGDVFTGDHILYALGKYMQAEGKLKNNTVVTTVMSNFGLYKALDKAGIGYAKTDVGDKYVYEYMVKNDCRLGGEQSGHIIISKYATTGDGILTSLKLMECMLAQKKRLSELARGFVMFPQVLKNVQVKDKAAALGDPAVQAKVEEVAQSLGENGRILVRQSGTEPVIRVMVEAETEKLCNAYVESVVEVICNQGHARV